MCIVSVRMYAFKKYLFEFFLLRMAETMINVGSKFKEFMKKVTQYTVLYSLPKNNVMYPQEFKLNKI